MQPITDGRHRNAALNDVAVLHRVEREVSAVAPPPEADAAAVELRELLQRLLHGGELVAQLDRAEVMLDGQREGFAAIRHAAIVHMQHGEALTRQDLVEEIVANPASRIVCTPGPP